MITRKLRPLWLTSRRCKNISLAIWSCFAIVIAPLRFRGLHGQTLSLHFEEAHFDYFPSYHITPYHWEWALGLHNIQQMALFFQSSKVICQVFWKILEMLTIISKNNFVVSDQSGECCCTALYPNQVYIDSWI